MAKTRTRKTKPADVISVNLETQLASQQAEDPMLSSILADLELEDAESTEAKTPESSGDVGETTIEAAVGGTPEVTAEAPKRKVKGAKAPKPEKAPAAPRVTFHGHSKSAVLDNRLGGLSTEFLVLENSDALLDPADLATKQAALKSELDTKVAKKVAEKCIMLFKWIKNGGELNEVMKRAFTVLVRDGKLTSGDKGNLQIALRDKYSTGTARSQSNQMFCLFPFLKITVKSKGEMVPNDESVILALAKTKLGL